MPTNDSAFKWLVQFQPQQYVDRFFPGATYVQMWPTELAREPLRADVLLEARLAGKAFGAHFEIQTDADKTMGRRLCTYSLLAEEQHGVPILSTVIYLEKCKTVASPWQRMGPDGNAIHTFHFHVVRLWEEPVEDWLTSGQVGLLPFIPFLKGATIDSLVPVAQALEQIPDQLQRASSVYYTIAFAERVFTPEIVNDFLRRNPMLDKFVQESPFYQETLKRGEERGLRLGEERGLEIGLQKGMQKGELEALRTTIVRFVKKRFPTLIDEAEAQLITIEDPANLQAIVDEIPFVPDEAAARALLDLPA